MTDAADDAHIVTVRIGDSDVRLRILDSSDAMVEANICMQEILLLTDWIERVRERFFVSSPSRMQRINEAALRATAILLQADCTRLDDVVQQLRVVFDRLCPGGNEDIPEEPNTVVFERLARVSECRRAACGKLLRELLVDAADREGAALDALLHHMHRETVMDDVLDAVVG